MPTSSRTQQITHRFSGGWAPEFGKLVSGLPTQTSEIQIPFALEAVNIFWRLDGGFQKIGGTAKVSAELDSGATIRGLYDYWRIGTTGTYAQRSVCHVGTLIMEDQGTGTWQNLLTGMESGRHPNYATFADLLIIASDSNTDVPKSWDQTTVQNLAGSPPNFAFSVEHKNRQWAAGVAAFPSRLYYTVADDPEDWANAGSGTIDISPGDGDEIRGIASYKNELWVFKGPNKGSIHRITGSTPSDFARVVFIRGLAAAGHSSITQFKDDIVFMTPSGSIRSLKATAAFGDYNDAAITFPINAWLVENLNKTQLKQAWIVADSSTSHLYVAVPTGSSTVNNVVLCLDYQFSSVQQPDRWSSITAWNANILATFTISGLPTVYAGGSDGFVRSTNISAKSIDGTTAIESLVVSPFLNYGSSTQFKTLTDVWMTISPQGNNQVIFYNWSRDSIYSSDVSLIQGTTAGGELDTFVLDTDLLGASAGSIAEIHQSLDEGGEAHWVQHRFTQDIVNQDFHVHAFTTGVQFDAVGDD